MYPIFVDMKGVKCVVVGAGKTAQRRISALLKECADITVISPEPISEELSKINIKYLQQEYAPDCLTFGNWVFACTDNKKLNDRIVRDCEDLGRFVCSVTEPHGRFIVPASCGENNVRLAVSTNGASPGLSAAICRELGEKLSEYDELCMIQNRLREKWKTTVKDPKKRHQALKELSSENMLNVYRNKGAEEYVKRAQQLICERIAVLCISFGTSNDEARKKNIETVENEIAKAFPNADVFRAFTSGMIISRLKKNGIQTDNVSQALTKLKEQGYTHVYCQPTHVIPGGEYDKLCGDIFKFEKDFTVLKTGRPLLTYTNDFLKLIQAMEGHIQHSEDTAYVLMGHGSAHCANMAYPAFDYCLKRFGYDNVFVGTMKGFPTIDTVAERLQETAYKNVVLQPMLLSAGKHALNDMSGNGENSWESVLTEKGYNVSVRLVGLGEIPAVRQIYVEHLRDIMDRFF